MIVFPGLCRRLLLSVIGAVALALILLLAAFNLVLRQRLRADADNALVSRAAAELASLRVTDGRLSVPEVPDAAALDAQTWVFVGRRPLEQPRTDPITEHAAEQLSGGPRRTENVPATDTRLYAV